MMITKHLHVTGMVQGAEFDPFVYGLAFRLGLRGWILSTSTGVDIEIQGPNSKVEHFIHGLESEALPGAKIESLKVVDISTDLEYSAFEIRDSAYIENALQLTPIDAALCPDCERELFDPEDRRYLYPFINCTNCSPRFTITNNPPHDHTTAMKDFPMCDECRAEYEDPNGRRFHVQLVTCPTCGPFTQLRYSPHNGSNISSIELRLSAVLKTRQLLSEGKIVAIKGLGGVHLICDAANERTVNELRRRKGNTRTPFASMFADLSIIQSYCEVNKEEAGFLTGHKKPIILLHAKSHKKIAASVIPNTDIIGAMLPYTPLHHLLLNQTDEKLKAQPAPSILAMTSGNFSEEPIAITNEEALEKLAPLADAFLLHNLDIHVR